MNKKGFTLIELLAVISILGILMVIAIPNVISIIDKGKKDTFINDAKKFISLAEYEVGIDPNKKPVISGQSTTVFLQYVDYTDILDTPDGDKYDIETSKVIVKNNGGALKYYVLLKPKKVDGRGVDLADLEILNSNERYKCVKNSNLISDAINAKLCQ